ncbi:MAG: hypothetical protein K6F45_04360 [Saccharofermentans sp.]|nr:hypothetical protein [Saccharofermentans sp.]
MNGDEVFTGFVGLDEVLGGYRPGTLNVIAGRIGIGKTGLALNIAKNAAKEYGRTVLYFSLIEDRAELVSRFALLEEPCRPGCESIGAMALRIGKLPVYFDDYTDFSPEYIGKRFRELSNKTVNGVELVIVDWFDRISLPYGNGFDDRFDELSCISVRLKKMAVELHVPILLLADVHRNSDFRGGHIPKLTDLRLHSTLDRDADSVVFVVRPGYYSMNNRDPKTQLIVAKNNYGEADVKINLLWDHRKRCFHELYNKDHKDRETMMIFKTVLAERGNYKYFTFLDRPDSFKSVFGGKDIARVGVYSTMVLDGVDTVAFCGRFEWKDGKITTLDGDEYNADMTVYGYSKYYDRDIEEEILEILVGDDW